MHRLTLSSVAHRVSGLTMIKIKIKGEIIQDHKLNGHKKEEKDHLVLINSKNFTFKIAYKVLYFKVNPITPCVHKMVKHS